MLKSEARNSLYSGDAMQLGLKQLQPPFNNTVQRGIDCLDVWICHNVMASCQLELVYKHISKLHQVGGNRWLPVNI